MGTTYRENNYRPKKSLGQKLKTGKEVIGGMFTGAFKDITQPGKPGKWNPKSVPKSKPMPESNTPERMALSPRRAADIKGKLRELEEVRKLP